MNAKEPVSGALRRRDAKPDPGVAEVYAKNVDELTEALLRGGDPQALESARVLIHKVISQPLETEGDPPGIELIGELMALLHAAGVNGLPTRALPQATIPLSSCSSVR
jgi:hypothetical protein